MAAKLTLQDLQGPGAPLYVVAEQIAHLIGCSPQALRMACRAGMMPYDVVVCGSHVHIATASFLSVTLGGVTARKGTAHAVGAAQAVASGARSVGADPSRDIY